jgi:hypothetical protein
MDKILQIDIIFLNILEYLDNKNFINFLYLLKNIIMIFFIKYLIYTIDLIKMEIL